MVARRRGGDRLVGIHDGQGARERDGRAADDDCGVIARKIGGRRLSREGHQPV